MSAAFDMVSFPLLLQKLDLYGFDENSLAWIKSYLYDRKQAVCIDGILSSFLDVNTGVPQGSILGPLLYTIFANCLPETIHDHPPSLKSHGDYSFNLHCEDCGGICCYADDSTSSCSERNDQQLAEKLTKNYNTISDYMSSNRLKLNGDKTHVMVMMTDQARKRKPNFTVNLNILGVGGRDDSL